MGIERVVEKFLAFVSPEPNSGCWLWTGFVSPKGYGQFRVGGRGGKKWRANRLAHALFKGEIPDGALVLHDCDNPTCVNPSHLHLGTPEQNTKEMFKRGRAPDRGGENHSRRKLSAADVSDIRSKRYSALEYAEMYGVTRRHIYTLWSGEAWGGTSGSSAGKS